MRYPDKVDERSDFVIESEKVGVGSEVFPLRGDQYVFVNEKRSGLPPLI